MNRIAGRGSIAVLLTLVLLLGLGMFLLEYLADSGDWVTFPGSPHVYNAGNIGCGLVTDRSGTMLLDVSEGRTYAGDPQTRIATLHWLGDREGKISAPAIPYYSREMAGFDRWNGLYSYGGSGSVAELTISAAVQKVALEAMGDYKGTVAVYNYKTGELLCAVTTPSYDPDNVPDIDGDTTGAYEGTYLNRFTQVRYVPGSIFKVVTTAAALENIDGIENLKFTCTGTYYMGVDKVTCEKSHGTIDLKTALAKSCNCVFAQISELIGAENLSKAVAQYRVVDNLTFDGITVSRGEFHLENAAPVEVAWSAIGQHLDEVNPCRFMTFMGAIAGHGNAAEPYLVAKITSGSRTVYTAKTVNTDRLMTADVADKLAEYMRNNVLLTYGADHFPGLSVCAKSGTAEVGGGKKPNATFAGFVQNTEYPLAFVVVVENGGYGSAVCVPIISKVLAACVETMKK